MIKKYDCVIVRTVSEIATPNKGTTDPQGFYGLSSLYLFADNASVNNNTCKCNQSYIEDQGNRGAFSANLTNEGNTLALEFSETLNQTLSDFGLYTVH